MTMSAADMLYSDMVACYRIMESTTKRGELTDALVSLFKRTPKNIVDKVTYLNQGKLYPDYMGVEIGVGEKMAMKAISLASGIEQSKVEEAYRRLGDLGSAAEEVLSKRVQTSLLSGHLTVVQVYDTLDRIARTSGGGSLDARLSLLAGLLVNANPEEAKYIVRTAIGKLRLGVADYTALDALAIAFTGDKSKRVELERAYNLCSDLGLVAATVAREGFEGLKSFKVQAGRPIRPMLAERLSTSSEIIEKMGGVCSAEYKFDGERMQIHKMEREVVIFSRRLEQITSNYPDAVELAKSAIKASTAILECEAVAVDKDSGDLLPFQQLMHRRRKYGIKEAMESIPISLFFFDVLMVDGEDMTRMKYSERRRVLESVVAAGERVQLAPARRVRSPVVLERYMEEAIQAGCEGLMVKALDGVYQAGSRGFLWIKLKREYRSELTDTLDLVVVGGFHGKGRRTGVYGALLLAVYNEEEDVFESVTKVGTGFTDEDLSRLYALLQDAIIPHRSPRVKSKMEADVWFTPKLVVEVIASEITLSPIHVAGWGSVRKDSGLALRFPKFTGKVRDDKSPEDATTTKELVEMYKMQLKKIDEKPELTQT